MFPNSECDFIDAAELNSTVSLTLGSSTQHCQCSDVLLFLQKGSDFPLPTERNLGCGKDAHNWNSSYFDDTVVY